MDGLGGEVLSLYLEQIKAADDEPEWPSGLALLRRAGFRLAWSERAESLPVQGLPVEASLVTGRFPSEHGITAERFYISGASGDLRRVDFKGTSAAALRHFAPGLGPLEEESLPTQLLKSPTIYELLGPKRRSAVVFGSFAKGAEWSLPADRETGQAVMLSHEIAAEAVPLFDRGSRDAAISLLIQERPPDLLTLYFRQILVESRFGSSGGCDEGRDLSELQLQALKGVDEQLWRILRKYRRAHPQAFKETSFLFTGSGGVIRAPERLDSTQLVSRLAAKASTESCSAWLRKARAQGDLALALDGGLAQIFLRKQPPGMGQLYREQLGCLSAALEALFPSPWLSIGAWLQPGSSAQAPRSLRYQLAFSQRLSSGREERLRQKILRMIDDGEETHAGEALLFPGPNLRFEEESGTEARWGGIEQKTMSAAFLLASRSLGEMEVNELRSISVEMVDIAPTILALLEAPEGDLPRAPLLSWVKEGEHQHLAVRHAPRQISPQSPYKGPQSFLFEKEDVLIIGLEESKLIWPPDQFVIRMGDQRFVWDAEKERFPEGLPCEYGEFGALRRWSCKLPVKREQPWRQLLALRRQPEGDSGEAAQRSFQIHKQFNFNPQAPQIQSLELGKICKDHLEVKLRAEDLLGLERAELILVEARGLGRPDHQALEASVQISLRKTELSCDPLSLKCNLPPVEGRFEGQLSLPFSKQILRHHRRSLLARAQGLGDREALRARFNAQPPTPEAQAPKRAFLLFRLCNLAGRCSQRPLVSDRDYHDLIQEPCP